LSGGVWPSPRDAEKKGIMKRLEDRRDWGSVVKGRGAFECDTGGGG